MESEGDRVGAGKDREHAADDRASAAKGRSTNG
jgi:hypothetical protein